MDFALMSCPYCGGVIDSSDPSMYECTGCGKHIYTDRESLRHFIRPGELEDRFNEAIDALAEENPGKALEITNELVDLSCDTDFDAFFLRGAVLAYMGEDGKAANNWKKGLELLDDYTNLDAYICLMSKSVAHMIYGKEKDYVDFDPLRYIDRLSDEIYADTGESCRSFLYYTIYRDYRILMGKLQSEGEETFRDVIPLLFKRIVGYHRNFRCLIRIIDEYLVSMSYNADTYKEDDYDDLHVYDLLKNSLKAYTDGMSDDDIRTIISRWNDETLESNQERLDAIMPHKKKGVLNKLLHRNQDDDGIDDAVDGYVRICLGLDPLEASEDAETVE